MNGPLSHDSRVLHYNLSIEWIDLFGVPSHFTLCMCIVYCTACSSSLKVGPAFVINRSLQWLGLWTKELSLCHKLWFSDLNIFGTQCRKLLIFQTYIIWSNKSHSLKYQRFTTLESKDIGIRKSEFEAKTQFLSWTFLSLDESNNYKIICHCHSLHLSESVTLYSRWMFYVRNRCS